MEKVHKKHLVNLPNKKKQYFEIFIFYLDFMFKLFTFHATLYSFIYKTIDIFIYSHTHSYITKRI